MLVGGHHGGTLSDALEVVARSLGTEAGAAYEVERDALVLVAQIGLSSELRAVLERLPNEPSFVAGRAVKSRRIVVECEVAMTTALTDVAQALSDWGWSGAVAVPLVHGREVLSVLVLFHKRPEVLDSITCAFLESAAALMTLAQKAASASPSHSPSRREDEQLGPLVMAGMLAAHFADDVRGPLAAVSLVLREGERMLDKMQAPGADTVALIPPFQQLLKEAAVEVKRAQGVTDQVVSAAQAGPKMQLLFADVLRDAVEIVRPLAEARSVALVAELEGEGYVTARRSELVPAFVAMITNAVQACDHGPRTRPATVRVSTEDETRGVSASIEDTGPGVPADIRSRIFDPFFSTTEGAAGIGLTLARHAIVGNSGHLEIAISGSLGGALFRAVLPRAVGAKKERRSSLSSATLRRVTPRPALLWIDKDAVFLASVRRALEGLEIRTATTSAEGADLVIGSVPPPELIFCELDLPDKSGLDLHAEIAKKSAEIATRFVFITDGVLSPERAAYVHESGCPTLVKPLDLGYVRALVYAASGEREAPSSRRMAPKLPEVDDPFDF